MNAYHKTIPRPGEKVYTSKDMKKRKEGLFGVGAVVIVLIIAIVLYFQYYKPADNNGLPGGIDISNITNGTDIQTTEEYLLGKAITDNDPDLCSMLETKEQNCYEELADTSEDACLKVEDYSKKKECIMSWVVEKDSTVLCTNLNEEDLVECGKLVDSCYGMKGDEKRLCQALANEDYTYCDNEDCLLQYAQEKEDVEPCALMEEPAMEVACNSVARNLNLCEDLFLATQKDYCYQIIGIEFDNAHFCSKISMENIYKSDCYKYFAIDNEQKDYCANLDLDYQHQCYMAYALALGDVGGCDAIDEDAPNTKNGCYYDFAIKYSKPEVCNKLGVSSKSYCYSNSIKNAEYLDYENCGDIDIPGWKDKCYTYAADDAEDITICDYIEGDNEKRICKEQFEEN